MFTGATLPCTTIPYYALHYIIDATLRHITFRYFQLCSVPSCLLLLRPFQIAANDSCWQRADLHVAAAAKV